MPLPAAPVRAPADAPRRRWSLERTLPLLMTGLLAVMLATTLAVTHQALTDSALDGARQRLVRAAAELQGAVRQNTAALRARHARRAADPVFARALADVAALPVGAAADSLPSVAAARAALGSVPFRPDTLLVTELWDAQGRRVAFFGADTEADGTAPPDGRESVSLPLRLAGAATAADSAVIGPLHRARGVAVFWIVAPVVADGRHLGYVASRQRVGQPGTDRQLEGLLGEGVTGFWRNADGRFWSTLSATVAEPPAGRDSAEGGLRFVRPGVGELLATEVRIDDTPLVLALEVPERTVRAGPLRTVRRLAVISLLLLVVGAATAWLVSRRITRPLAALSGAAARVARGEYDTRVPAEGSDELARLAASFNHMAAEVGGSRRSLEERERTLRDARETAERLREQAEAANRAKSEFLTVMSHELRTPLNAIGGYAELMEMGIRGPVTDAQRRDLERIRVSQQHLLGLISGVLDLSRIETGRVSYDLAVVALGPFLSGLDSLVAPQAAAKELALVHVPCPPQLAVLADREKLRQIVLNLLSNAVRYTHPGGRITLSTGAVDERTVRIAVQDTGIGIPRDEQEQIFEPFVQLDRSLTQGRDGVGLGLAISRDLAQGMGGDITVCSEPGVGSTFIVTLPRAIATDGALAVPPTGEYRAVVPGLSPAHGADRG